MLRGRHAVRDLVERRLRLELRELDQALSDLEPIRLIDLVLAQFRPSRVYERCING